MPSAFDLSVLRNASVVAPAGHGKTELIAEIAAITRRTLILTHTHAGVHAIRHRLEKHSIPSRRFAVDTIAGWCMRYAYAFPGVAKPPLEEPKNSTEWDQLYNGTIAALTVPAIRDVVAASYDRVLIDEYQDCGSLQHALAVSLSDIVPTIIFGDPMQGIFEFSGATLSWSDNIHKDFPLAGTLLTPHRWAKKNPILGQWIAEVRLKLLRGEQIDLNDPRIVFKYSNSAFDMGTLFDGIEEKEGSFTAIHCNKALCYKLASAANGGYQAIEEVAAKRLVEFATAWDAAVSGSDRRAVLRSILSDSFHIKNVKDVTTVSPEAKIVLEDIQRAMVGLGLGNGGASARKILGLCRLHPTWKLYRSGLWRDAENACDSLGSERCATMVDAVASIRQRTSQAGRNLPRRTISTPLLLKGLEFDHVIIPDATHFCREPLANAKLFYVAISRATTSLTISSSSQYIKFDTPLT